MKKNNMLKHVHISILILVIYGGFVFVAHSQSQSGFISLDCGLPENSAYTENSTEINYISDAAFINSGESKSVSPEYKVGYQQQSTTLRSFPQGIRNCYTINTKPGTKYLIRATFLYGNYDGLNKNPEFEIHLGANFADTVKIVDVSSDVLKEVIHFPVKKYVRVCLANTGSGTPFINALELRPLLNTTYKAPDGLSLGLVARMDLGSTTNRSYRYPYDAYDRIWIPYVNPQWRGLSTSETVESLIDFKPPNIVMNNAVMPAIESGPLRFDLEATDTKIGYFVYMHFAEIQKLNTANESRSFSFNVNGRQSYDLISPDYLSSNTIYSTLPFTGQLVYNFTLEKLPNSTLPPIINALEFYSLMSLSQPETEENDVEALTKIKSFYGLKRNWDGDPCRPVNYLWTGLNCSIDVTNLSRITSLDLSSSRLNGEIPESIADLSMLESLDLSNNNLTGSVPDFLTKLTNLRVLNLAKNKLTGVVPAKLIERSNDGSLSLNFYENEGLLCGSSPCQKKKKKKSNVVVPVAASVGGLMITLGIVVAIFLGVKKKKKQVLGQANQMDSFDSKNRQLSYSEVARITKNFDQLLGEGGFAKVYHGVLDDGTEVAVKKLNLPDADKGRQVHSYQVKRKKEEAEGYFQQFQAEVKLLLTVYHGNLTSLVGYCNQGSNRILVYEFMANGDLESHLSGKRGNVLSWETRLQIAIDSAQGLEYLHVGCNPAIIHRDIKPANILLTKNFRAKLADFGLSKFFQSEDGTHVSTFHGFAGTRGYIDPDLGAGAAPTKKSDVYSFGVVLLELVTSQRSIKRVNEDEWVHLSRTVRLLLNNGNIKDIVDKELRGDFEVNSAWKAVELAMDCVAVPASNRPDMTKVVIQLRECLAMEQSRKNNNNSFVSSSTDSSILSNPTTTISQFRPLAR